MYCVLIAEGKNDCLEFQLHVLKYCQVCTQRKMLVTYTFVEGERQRSDCSCWEVSKVLSQESEDDINFLFRYGFVRYPLFSTMDAIEEPFNSKPFSYQDLPASSKLLFFLSLAMCLKYRVFQKHGPNFFLNCNANWVHFWNTLYTLGVKEKLANILVYAEICYKLRCWFNRSLRQWVF